MGLGGLSLLLGPSQAAGGPNCGHMTGQIQRQLAVVGSRYWPTEMEAVFPDRATNSSAVNALE